MPALRRPAHTRRAQDRTKERLPQLRPANTAFDGQFQIPTLHRLGVDGVFADNAGTAVAVRRRVFR